MWKLSHYIVLSSHSNVSKTVACLQWDGWWQPKKPLKSAGLFDNIQILIMVKCNYSILVHANFNYSLVSESWNKSSLCACSDFLNEMCYCLPAAGALIWTQQIYLETNEWVLWIYEYIDPVSAQFLFLYYPILWINV